LARGRAGFKQGFSCPVLLVKTHIMPKTISHTGLSPSLARLSNASAMIYRFISLSAQLTLSVS